jgi:hypothetical protein
MCDQPFAVHAFDLGLCDTAPSEACSRLELPVELKELVGAALIVLFRTGLKPPVTDIARSVD